MIEPIRVRCDVETMAICIRHHQLIASFAESQIFMQIFSENNVRANTVVCYFALFNNKMTNVSQTHTHGRTQTQIHTPNKRSVPNAQISSHVDMCDMLCMCTCMCMSVCVFKPNLAAQAAFALYTKLVPKQSYTHTFAHRCDNYMVTHSVVNARQHTHTNTQIHTKKTRCARSPKINIQPHTHTHTHTTTHARSHNIVLRDFRAPQRIGLKINKPHRMRSYAWSHLAY